MKYEFDTDEDIYLKHWKRRFNLILLQDTNWNKLYFSLEKDSFPKSVDIDDFFIKYSQELNLKFNYKIDLDSRHYNITITK